MHSIYFLIQSLVTFSEEAIDMVKARKYVVIKAFEGLPKRDDFKIIEYELPALRNGEILVKAEWVSLDPYLRVYAPFYQAPYDQFSYQVGMVEDSKDPRYPVGTRVVTHKGWCDYSIADTNEANLPFGKVYKLPKLNGLSNSLGVGAVGMPGITAYFGFLEICNPKAGETVVVSGAAGAVGSLVGQIAKIKGCRVIGIAGSEEKVKWLEEIGFDKAINYKIADVSIALRQAAPKGVDCYFDNVGGELSSIIISQMNQFGRVSVCGHISHSADSMPHATILQPAIVFKQLKIEGFHVWRWLDRQSEAFTEIIKWIQSGQLKPKEHITEGFENIYDAFDDLLNWRNFGKAVVKL